MSEAARRTLLFLHIRKTGGTSLTRRRFAARLGRPAPPGTAAEHGEVRISLEVDRAIRPREVSASSDNRRLAIAVRRVALLPAGQPAD
jgi:hypothetical protein